MKMKNLKIPAIIIAIGLVAAIVVSLLTGMVQEPTIQSMIFPYSVTYTLNGESQTLEGAYRSSFTYTGEGTAPLVRHYEGSYLTITSENHPSAYPIAEKDGLELCIVTVFFDRYLMGDTKGEPDAYFLYDPYLAVLDQDGIEYMEEEMLDQFDAELVSWELPVPVENTFAFAGFSYLHAGSMIAMLIVGVLVILACMIFVKRDKTMPYKPLDKISVVLNFILVLAVIPFATLTTWLMQILVSGDEFAYQLYLCVPAISAFAAAASIALRRKGFTKAGFFSQFVGPVLYVLLLIADSV